jgi:hypothetical protein
MMWRTKLILTLLILATLKAPGSDRYLTLTAIGGTTNSFEIADGEIAELVSFPATFNYGLGRSVQVYRSGKRIVEIQAPSPGQSGNSFPQNPVIVAGPARLELYAGPHRSLPQIGVPLVTAICSFRIFSDRYHPPGTMVIPPGAGGGVIKLECSSNLITWDTATNGVYAGHSTAKFFHLALDRILPGRAEATSVSNPSSEQIPMSGFPSPLGLGRRFMTWTPDPAGEGGPLELEIPKGQAVKLASVLAQGARFDIEQGGIDVKPMENNLSYLLPSDPLIVAGPARFKVQGSPTYTLEFLPNAEDPQSTLVVPPGAAGGRIQLQTSTNLTDWVSAEPGAFTNLTAATFFRITLERIPK